MIRNYGLTYAAVTLRFVLPLLKGSGVEAGPAHQNIAWPSWVPNLIVAEWVILQRREMPELSLPLPVQDPGQSPFPRGKADSHSYRKLRP